MGKAKGVVIHKQYVEGGRFGCCGSLKSEHPAHRLDCRLFRRGVGWMALIDLSWPSLATTKGIRRLPVRRGPVDFLKTPTVGCQGAP